MKEKKGQWPDPMVDDLIDVIIENDKFKEKLLLTNTKKVKNRHYYSKAIDETNGAKKGVKNFLTM